MISEIKTVVDLKIFFKQLFDEGTNAHPDDDFLNYINLETGGPTYTIEGGTLRNRLMETCFEVCDTFNLDIYDVMQEIYLKESGLDSLIPLPSESTRI